MKITTHDITALLTATLLLTACQQADEPQLTPQRQPVALQLTSNIGSVTTRAYNSTWEASDKIGVFTTKATTLTTTYSGDNNEDANVLYTTTGTSDFSTTTPIYLPIDGSDIDVYAYYPHTTPATPATLTDAGVTISSDLQTLTVNLETTQTAEGQKTYDVMKAKALSSTSTIDIDHRTVNLTFTHCLSKVLIKVKLDTGYSEGDLTGITAQLTNQPVTATFAPLTQTLAIPFNWSSSPQIIVPVTLDSNDPDWGTDSDVKHAFRALILPNTTTERDGENNSNEAGSGRQIVLSVGDIAYTYDIPTSQDFMPGQQTTFELTLAPESLTVTATIANWTQPAAITSTTPLYPD